MFLQRLNMFGAPDCNVLQALQRIATHSNSTWAQPYIRNYNRHSICSVVCAFLVRRQALIDRLIDPNWIACPIFLDLVQHICNSAYQKVQRNLFDTFRIILIRTFINAQAGLNRSGILDLSISCCFALSIVAPYCSGIATLTCDFNATKENGIVSTDSACQGAHGHARLF